MPARATARARRPLSRLLLLGAVLGAALALAEGGLVLAGGFPPNPPLDPGDRVAATSMGGAGVLDAEVGWKLAPGTVVDATEDFEVEYGIGPDGWRLTPDADRAGGSRTLVCVGGSCTFGTGVEDDETFVALLGSEPGWRAVNLGMAGFGVDQMWRALEVAGVEERPKVVVASFVLDDLDRSLTAYRFLDGWIPKPSFTVEGGRLVERGPEHAAGRLARWFERSTRLGELWRRASARLELKTGHGRRWNLNRRLFEAMRDTCRRHGAELVVVFLPSKHDWEPIPMLSEAFAELEVLFLDLGDEPLEQPGDLFFPGGPHLGPAGHRHVAERIRRFLVDVGLFAGDG